MKLNYIAIVASIIAFASLALPWWTMTIRPHYLYARRMGISVEFLAYPYQTKTSTTGVPQNVMERESAGAGEPWFGLATFTLIVIAGIAGIVGSVMVGKTGRIILIVTGILALLSVIVFAAGLQNELSNEALLSGFPEVSLFSSGIYSVEGVLSMDYSTYLSAGFWLALVAAIVAFISLLKHPMAPRQRAQKERT